MIGLFDAVKIGAGAVLGAALFSGPAYLYGKSDGRTEAATIALEKTVEVLQSREKTNVEISSSDAASLCGHFGLSGDEQRECMRRVAEAKAKP